MDDAPHDWWTLVVPGDPWFQERPRLTTIAGHAHLYTPPRTRAHKNKIRMLAAAQGDHYLIDGPIEMEIVAYWGTRSPLKKSLREEERKDKKPDVDNVGKIVMDALERVMYLNDSQISDLTVRKRRAAQGEDPRTEIRIRAAS